MTRLLSFIIAALIVGIPAVAQTIIVRSGEHEGFTRLALKMPEKVKWSIDASGRSLFLRTDLSSIDFDISYVFDRISRDRLVDLAQDGPGLDLVFSLGCDCSVSSFVDSTGLLAIDIKDNIGKSAHQRQTYGLPINQTPYRFSGNGKPTDTAHARSQELMLPVVIGRVPVPAPAALPVQRRRNSPARLPGSVNISEERLLAQIDRASEQGLLDFKVKPETNGTGMASASSPEATETAQRPEEKVTTPPISVSVTTVIDRDLAQFTQMMDHSSTTSDCFASDRIALHEWGGDRPFAAEIGHWRSQLFGEFDKLNPGVALKLARAYLHFGFGAEAAKALMLSTQTSTDKEILKAISQILETGALKGPNPFTGQQECPGDVALWSVLSSNTIAHDINNNAVQLAFSRLPLHLRSYLGPQISQKFTTAGDSQMADSILRAITRAGVEPGSGLELAKASVAELQGDTEIMGRELAKSLTADAEHAPEALIMLVAQRLETRGSVSPGFPELVAAYALEFRNAPIGADLRRSHAIALALAGQLSKAFETLSVIEEKDGFSSRLSVLIPLLALLSERADDVIFLQTALKTRPDSIQKIPAETSTMMAKRLLDIGLPAQAERWIPVAKEGSSSNEQRLLRAEIALANRLPNRAMVELLGLDGPGAARLRAAAMLQHGDYHLAGQMLATAGDYDGAARGFWLAEEWETIPKQTGVHYTQVVDRSRQLRADDGISTQLAPLAEARALVQSGSSARAQVMQLLQTVSIESQAPQ